MATCVLLIAADRHLAASLKLLELKYKYSPYLIIAGCVLVRSMTNNVTLGLPSYTFCPKLTEPSDTTESFSSSKPWQTLYNVHRNRPHRQLIYRRRNISSISGQASSHQR